ncbi:50S ribosomal protein L15 [Gimesia aquarii]|uniref:Large ribosomal subunit protein uL15 n=1 Tax=Gimesia aquarii TaxID=2527964 RepID=A0A517WPA1_9PLAN|nr:50S ribosomal protein L15 [Gimesia aquarii]QDU07085.1 50S ribosomal protein L15 [Gimesia aquarii]
MIIDDVHRGIKKHKKRKRVGRGPGSGHGKTSTRGHKGYGSRAGSSRRTSFEGGQTPLALRVAKRGFNNKQFAKNVAVVNVSSLEQAFENGAEVTPEVLAEKGLAKGRFDQVKILGNGDLSKKLTVTAHLFSQSAETKIQAAGGTVSRILS